ncbi:hypothetical protein BRC83_06175 [Halobacteriales archaeon QS_1_68_17]|nr:MAG: hypothetical protein BRC83_06175 [Halobacteriales archaeon QS_1_68_17]
MEDVELGQATIVYEDPEEGRTELTVPNEKLVYARDHWMVRSGTDEAGNDLLRQIPRDRVHRVDRTVEQFEDEVGTVKRRVESLATDLRRKLPVDLGERRGRERGRTGPETPVTIPIDEEEHSAADREDTGDGEDGKRKE